MAFALAAAPLESLILGASHSRSWDLVKSWFCSALSDGINHFSSGFLNCACYFYFILSYFFSGGNQSWATGMLRYWATFPKLILFLCWRPPSLSEWYGQHTRLVASHTSVLRCLTFLNNTRGCYGLTWCSSCLVKCTLRLRREGWASWGTGDAETLKGRIRLKFCVWHTDVGKLCHMILPSSSV